MDKKIFSKMEKEMVYNGLSHLTIVWIIETLRLENILSSIKERHSEKYWLNPMLIKSMYLLGFFWSNFLVGYVDSLDPKELLLSLHGALLTPNLTLLLMMILPSY